MSINKKIIIAVLIGGVFGVSSCKKYLNVNTNPNGVLAPTVSSLLTGSELYVGTSVGVDMEIDGSLFAQYWTQSPGASQYHSLDEYAPSQDAFSTLWANLYSAEENFYQLYKLADSSTPKNTQYMAIALIMQAYTFQLITDAYGDVPCSQALKGQYADAHVVNPKYDPQDSVYNTILTLIDSANVLINPSAAVTPSSDDLIYGGSMTEWQKFANTLALRVYMRMSAKNPAAAQAGITALYASAPVTSAGFIGVGDDAAIAYGFNSANNNPLYADEAGLAYTQNFVASNSCLDSMQSNNDPRLTIFYEPVFTGGPLYPLTSASTFASLPQGDYNNIAYSGYSYPTVFVAGDAQNLGKIGSYKSNNAPVNLITSYESLFLQAEAVARGWATGDDNALFYSAIKANFDYYNYAFSLVDSITGDAAYNQYITAGGTWTHYPTTGGIAAKLPYIINQKYFAMCGNEGFEAWTEWRRTGYPNWFTVSMTSITGSTAASFPKRFYYPTSESTTNSSFPGLQPLTAKVWWDLL